MYTTEYNLLRRDFFDPLVFQDKRHQNIRVVLDGKLVRVLKLNVLGKIETNTHVFHGWIAGPNEIEIDLESLDYVDNCEYDEDGRISKIDYFQISEDRLLKTKEFRYENDKLKQIRVEKYEEKKIFKNFEDYTYSSKGFLTSITFTHIYDILTRITHQNFVYNKKDEIVRIENLDDKQKAASNIKSRNTYRFCKYNLNAQLTSIEASSSLTGSDFMTKQAFQYLNAEEDKISRISFESQDSIASELYIDWNHNGQLSKITTKSKDKKPSITEIQYN